MLEECLPMVEKSAFVVSRDWLKERLGKPGIAIVDASWYLPAAGRNGQEEYNAAHIPGAVFFDQDSMSVPWESRLMRQLLSMTESACFPHRASGGCSA
jgi:3-mercaptopyruvate sulfurtransferase SseA